ncbi:hypothetical protein H6G80_04215 [Nostoc sp. FACHB-87]|uniref:DUF6335 family protein n=1 Tax=Nostocaceae TaxID=1162 RepID=UPI001686FF36|nr:MULTISPECIES: DUF6335 family protein [Nostocaceae]MBD2453280.1 hypothetical protein [Nostoc sp. FACHB-87]MBD2474940.1 hypothetical protein [Anabaena sp. FACHB-83]
MTEKNQHPEVNSEDLPQEITESYGTGVKELPGYNIGERSLDQTTPEYPDSPEVTTQDGYTYWQDTVGDEAVGGTVAVPEQDVTEEIAAAVGLEMDDRAFLRTNEILEQRDDRRWELDPKSSEDYQER